MSPLIIAAKVLLIVVGAMQFAATLMSARKPDSKEGILFFALALSVACIGVGAFL